MSAQSLLSMKDFKNAFGFITFFFLKIFLRFGKPIPCLPGSQT